MADSVAQIGEVTCFKLAGKLVVAIKQAGEGVVGVNPWAAVTQGSVRS